MNLRWIIPEIKQKTFLQIGLLALVFLIPLAATSFKRIQQKLGLWWKKIHKLVYVITLIILLHITIASKGDIVDPVILFSIFLFAMALRLPWLRSLRVRTLPVWLTHVNDYLTNNENAS